MFIIPLHQTLSQFKVSAKEGFTVLEHPHLRPNLIYPKAIKYSTYTH